MTNKKLRHFLFLIILVLSGCAHEETNESNKTIYSASTQKEFEQIEKGDVYKQSLPPAHDLAKRPLKKSVAPVSSPKENPKLIPSTQLSARSEERLQEINQNLAFYCMKHRQDGTFKNEDQCLKFTQEVLKSCEKKHKLINTVMVNCIKDRLKKRR